MVASKVLALLYKFLGIATGLLASIGVFGAIDFKGTITLGSVLLALIIVALAGVFTIRSKIATIWREEAEGEKAKAERLEAILARERTERATFDREQQELRHELKGKIAAAEAQLKVAEAKTDLTTALEAIRVMNADLAQSVSGSILQMMRTSATLSEEREERTHHLLVEIRDRLPKNGGKM